MKKMSWCDHVEYIVKRLRLLSLQLYRIKHSSSVQLPKTVFKAMGESILQYGITVYGSCSHSRAKQIDKVLHRLSANILYGTNCDDLDTISNMRAAEVTSLHNLFMQVVVIRNYFSCKFKQLESKPRVLSSV